MPEQITSPELERAALNLERLARFIGERRGWVLASDAGPAAISVRNAAGSLAALLAETLGGNNETGPGVRPPKLEPASIVSANRLAKFAEYIDQLQEWFAARAGAELPSGGERLMQSIQQALALTERSIGELMGPASAPLTGSQPVVAADLGPVAAVDMTARLVFEESAECPLLQVFRGVVELTPEAKGMVDQFFASQGIDLTTNERRRLHDKILRWIQATPEGQVLVVKLSGLTGRAEAYSSYRPKKTAPRKP